MKKKKEYNSYWMTNIVFDEKYKINVKKLINYLEKRNIQARPFFSTFITNEIFQIKKNLIKMLIFFIKIQ